MIKCIKYHIFGHMDYFFRHEKIPSFHISPRIDIKHYTFSIRAGIFFPFFDYIYKRLIRLTNSIYLRLLFYEQHGQIKRNTTNDRGIERD